MPFQSLSDIYQMNNRGMNIGFDKAELVKLSSLYSQMVTLQKMLFIMEDGARTASKINVT